MIDKKIMTREAEEGSVDRPNDRTIYSGQFMVSDVHEREEDFEDTVSAVKEEPKQPVYDFKRAAKEIATSYKFGPRSTNTLEIDASLTKLFECMTLAYSGKLTSPKWKQFKGLKLTLKDKVRLNNIIWREWHMQYIQQKKPYIAQFSAPLSDETHCKPEAVVLEGKYWKRRLESVTAEYKKSRLFFKSRLVTFPPDQQLREVASHAELLERIAQQNALPLSVPTTSSQLAGDEELDMDFMDSFADTLFPGLNPPFAFPHPREMTQLGNADLYQPGLVQLQPNLEDFMDTLEPFQDYLMQSGRSQLGNNQLNTANSTISTPLQGLGQGIGLQTLDEAQLLGDPGILDTPAGTGIQPPKGAPPYLDPPQATPQNQAVILPVPSQQNQPQLLPSINSQQNQTSCVLPSGGGQQNLVKPAQLQPPAQSSQDLLKQLQQMVGQQEAQQVQPMPIQTQVPQAQQQPTQNIPTMVQSINAAMQGMPTLSCIKPPTLAPQAILSLLFPNSVSTPQQVSTPAPVIQTVATAPVQTIQVIPATNLEGYLAINQQPNTSSILSPLISQTAVTMATNNPVMAPESTKISAGKQGPQRSSNESIRSILAGTSTPPQSRKKQSEFRVPSQPAKSTPTRKKPPKIMPATTMTTSSSHLGGISSQNLLAKLLTTGNYHGSNISVKQEPMQQVSSSVKSLRTTTASYTPIRPAVTSTVANTSAVTFTVSSSMGVSEFQKNILYQAAKQACGTAMMDASPSSPAPTVVPPAPNVVKKVTFSTPSPAPASPSSIKSGSTTDGSPQPPSPNFSLDSPTSVDPNNPPKFTKKKKVPTGI